MIACDGGDERVVRGTAGDLPTFELRQDDWSASRSSCTLLCGQHLARRRDDRGVETSGTPAFPSGSADGSVGKTR